MWYQTASGSLNVFKAVGIRKPRHCMTGYRCVTFSRVHPSVIIPIWNIKIQKHTHTHCHTPVYCFCQKQDAGNWVMLSFKGNVSCSNDGISRLPVLCVKTWSSVFQCKALEDVPECDHIWVLCDFLLSSNTSNLNQNQLVRSLRSESVW